MSAQKKGEKIKQDLVALYIAGRDARTHWVANAVALSVAAYAISQIDLIPDYIPVIGYLDDLIIVPLGIMLAVRLIPDDLMVEFCDAAENRGRLRASWTGVAAIVLIWIIAIAVVGFYYYRNPG